MAWVSALVLLLKLAQALASWLGENKKIEQVKAQILAGQLQQALLDLQDATATAKEVEQRDAKKTPDGRPATGPDGHVLLDPVKLRDDPAGFWRDEQPSDSPADGH